MKTTLALFVFVFSALTASSQPDTLWTNNFHYWSNQNGKNIELTNEGGYIIVGSYITNLFNPEFGIVLIKTDSEGIEEWHRFYNWSDMEWGYSVHQVSDGGYVISGSSLSVDFQVLLFKVDINGDVEWRRHFAESSFGYCSQQTSDGGYIIVGRIDSYSTQSYDVYLVKTDSSGNEQWSQTYGGPEDDRGYYVYQTSEGGVCHNRGDCFL